MASDGGRWIGPVRMAAIDSEAAVARVVAAVAQGSGAIFAFCNMHTFNVARANPDLVAALGKATVFNDGIGIDVASRILHGRAFPANLNGTDLTPAVLAALPATTDVFLLGSAPGVAARAGAVIARQFANVRIVGAHDGFFADADSDALAAEIRAAGAALVLIGMGNPRQELWAARYGAATGAVTMCVGAFLDFTAGEVSRAPTVFRTLRSEWIYRLMREPRRMTRRYLGGAIPFLWAVARERLTRGSS